MLNQLMCPYMSAATDMFASVSPIKGQNPFIGTYHLFFQFTQSVDLKIRKKNSAFTILFCH